MRFSLLFHLGALAAFGAPALGALTPAQDLAANDLATLAARGVEEPSVLEARRDPGLNHLPKKPKKAPAPAPVANLPPARGAGRAAQLRNMHPGFGQKVRRDAPSVLEARRDPGLNHLPKKPKKAPAPAPVANLPPARGAGRAAQLRNMHPGFGQNNRRDAPSVLEARRDPGLNHLPKKAPAPAPVANLPPARGAGRAAQLRKMHPVFGHNTN